MRTAVPIESRFWQKVDKTEDGCWEWTAYRNNQGYGRIYADGEAKAAHRLSWELVHGPVLDGFFVCHQCDNPACVRPDHLFLGTAHDNVRDAITKGRFVFGMSNLTPGGTGDFAPKLNADQVLSIRQRYAMGQSQTGIALDFRIARATVWEIVNRKIWTHV